VDTIRIAKRSLFPNGYLAPPPIDPTPEEQAAIRERLAARIRQVVPGKSTSSSYQRFFFSVHRGVAITDNRLSGWIAPLILGAQPPAREQTIHDILDPLSSAECNSHLVMFALDSVLMTLIPEMGNTTDAGMMDGPPSMVRTQSELTRPVLDLRVLSRGNLDAGGNGDDGGEKGRNPSPSQSSAITGMYVHV